MTSERGEGQRWQQQDIQQQERGHNEEAQLEGVTVHLGSASALIFHDWALIYLVVNKRFAVIEK